MEKELLIKMAQDYIKNSKDNYIVSDGLVEFRIFDAPIFAFGSADDEYFKLLKQPSVIGEHFLLPKEWLPSAKTVISFFLPFSDEVKSSNKKDMSLPSREWLYGRVEGHELVNKLSMYIKSELKKAGYEAIVPTLDERFWSNSSRPSHELKFTCNWSERHVAFICGLGTFGISKGLITHKGTAGRFGSIITELYFPPDNRDYKDIYEYCSMCGKCAENCPVGSISIEKGKDNILCSQFLDRTAEIFKPRYGCGKCQVDVPCESKIPVR